MLTALRVVRLVDAAALAEECGGGAVAIGLAGVGNCLWWLLAYGKMPLPLGYL